MKRRTRLPSRRIAAKRRDIKRRYRREIMALERGPLSAEARERIARLRAMVARLTPGRRE